MQLLIDTQILLWSLAEPARLGPAVAAVLEDRRNTVAFSVVSVWEIAIKAALGRVDFGHRPDVVLAAARRTGFLDLPLTAEVACRVATLPWHHRDPFDRLLVAQAMEGPYRFYTADPALRPYSELVELVG